MEVLRIKAERAQEKIIIVLGTICYLWIFNHVLPHGDALRVVRQIESSNLLWNPNHLIFDPVGYLFHSFFKKVFPQATPLDSFEVLSMISTVVSLIIFIEILIRIGVKWPVRVIVVICFFSSASILSLAGSQYYFMIQMPFLLGALYLYMDYVVQSRTGKHVNANLYGIGALLAIATLIMFNNLLAVIAAGIAVGFVHTTWSRFELRNTMRLYTSAAAIGFPAFICGYMLSETTSSMLDWLLSYEGNADSRLNEFYGLKWTMSGIVQGAIKTGFNFVLGSMIEEAGLGTLLHVFVFGKTIEFIPQWSNIILSMVSIPATMLINIWILYFILRRIAIEPAVRFLALWLLAYLIFNFLWSCNNDIFWIQTIPAVWLLLLLSFGAVVAPVLNVNRGFIFQKSQNWRWYGLALYAVILLIVNTVNIIIPLADRDYFTKQTQHAGILREGDLEIIPGWDQQKWMMLRNEDPKVQRIILMNMAVAGSIAGNEIQRLPELVESHLQDGGRVIIARVYDLDEDIMPWYGLQKLGWPRNRIQEILSPFCNRELERINSVVFRELYICSKSNISR